MPFIRGIAGHPGLLINTGSVGLSYDGDPRASYLILEESSPSIRRVENNIEKELNQNASPQALLKCHNLSGSMTAELILRSQRLGNGQTAPYPSVWAVAAAP